MAKNAQYKFRKPKSAFQLAYFVWSTTHKDIHLVQIEDKVILWIITFKKI